VRALESRSACEISFPRLLGYRYAVAGEREHAPIVGESSIRVGSTPAMRGLRGASMTVWLLTSIFYGQWLPGDPRGSVTNVRERALRADIDEAAWSSLYSTVSRPFPKPASGKIAVKVINHYGDEVLKALEVS
jgi:hypothetical protein